MIVWVFAVPVVLLITVLALERLEARVVAPVERESRIRALIDSASEADIEQNVAVLLAPTIAPRRPAKAS